MKAAVCRRYGPPEVVRIEQVEKPVPGDDEVLVAVRAAAVNPLDIHLMRGRPYIARAAFGLRRPKATRPGRDVSGRIEAVGKNVTRFEPGDAVFGTCRGAFAEYACAAESALAAKPPDLSFEQAACLPVAGITALQGLRDAGRIQPGQKVLINGASGGVGTFAVQIAKAFGAEVTGVCSTRNLDLVRSIGADRAVDYTQEDFTRSGQRYDLILDLVGNHAFSAFRRVLAPRGLLVSAGGPRLDDGGFGRWAARLIKGLILSRFTSQKLVICVARLGKEDLNVLGEMIASGKVVPVIDRCYSLDETPEALRHVADGHARGKVVIVPRPGDR